MSRFPCSAIPTLVTKCRVLRGLWYASFQKAEFCCHTLGVSFTSHARRVQEISMLWVLASREVFCIQHFAWCEGYTLMRQSTAPLPNFSHVLREGGLGTFIRDIIFPCRQQSSHLSVTVSPEEYISELSVGTSSQFASSMQMPCSTVVSFMEAIWTYFTLFYVKVNIGSCVGSPSWCFADLCPVA